MPVERKAKPFKRKKNSQSIHSGQAHLVNTGALGRVRATPPRPALSRDTQDALPDAHCARMQDGIGTLTTSGEAKKRTPPQALVWVPRVVALGVKDAPDVVDCAGHSRGEGQAQPAD